MRKPSSRFEQQDIIKQALAEMQKLMEELVIANELPGKTQVEALVHIAEKNNCTLKVADARRILLWAGLMSSKNAPTVFHTVITRSGKFERVAQGEYRLIEGMNRREEIAKEAEAVLA